MSTPAAPVSSREMARLIERWGGRRTGNNGGHAIFTLNEQRVQLPGLGRKMPVTYNVVRKAAAAVGTDIQGFLRGPQ